MISLIRNTNATSISSGGRITQVQSARLQTGDTFRWYCRYAEDYTDQESNLAAYEGPYLRIYPSLESRELGACMRSVASISSPETVITPGDGSGRNIARGAEGGPPFVGPRTPGVQGPRSINEAQDNSGFFYEIDCIPGGSFIAPFPCDAYFVTYYRGSWLFTAWVKHPESVEEMGANVSRANQSVYGQTRNTQASQGPRMIAIPNGCVGFKDIGSRGSGLVLASNEDSLNMGLRNVLVGATLANHSGGIIPVGNSKYLLVDPAGLAVNDKISIEFQVKL